jgi:hypothetical protein
METSYLPSNNFIVVHREVALWYSGSMLLPSRLLSAFLVASPLAAVANEVKVKAEDPVLLAVPVAAELLRKLPQLPMKHPSDPTDVFPPAPGSLAADPLKQPLARHDIQWLLLCTTVQSSRSCVTHAPATQSAARPHSGMKRRAGRTSQRPHGPARGPHSVSGMRRRAGRTSQPPRCPVPGRQAGS